MLLPRKILNRTLGGRLSHESIILQLTPFPLRIFVRSLKILLKCLSCIIVVPSRFFFFKLFSFFYLREALQRIALSSDSQGWAATTKYINTTSCTGASQDTVQLITVKISVIDLEKLKASVYLPIHQAVITTVSWQQHRKLKNKRNSFVLNNTDWECQIVVAEGHNYKMFWLKSLISASQGTC